MTEHTQSSESKTAPWLIMGVFVCLIAGAIGWIALGKDVETPQVEKPGLGGWNEREMALISSLSPVPALPPSPGNAVVDDPRAARLGQALFFDDKLSANGKVSCATCHVPGLFFTDGLRLAEGMGVGRRHTPGLLGSQWAPYLFWDGRADSVWSQALGPVESSVEHGFSRVAVARVLHNEYKDDYEALFGPLPAMADSQRFPSQGRPIPRDTRHAHHQAWRVMSVDDKLLIDKVFANFGKAIEAYTRQLVPGESDFDRYVAALKEGDAEGGGHLSESARRGLRAFVGEAQCVNCHNGPLLTDMGFHNLGLPQEGERPLDMGRAVGARQVLEAEFRCGQVTSDQKDCQELRFLQPDFEDFLGAFKTPSLRHVAQTAPYMHDGRFGSLEEVIAFYKTLPGKAVVGHRELVLSLLEAEVSTADLVAFLKSLSAPLPEARLLHPPQRQGLVPKDRKTEEGSTQKDTSRSVQ